jgi:hypothetical protein
VLGQTFDNLHRYGGQPRSNRSGGPQPRLRLDRHHLGDLGGVVGEREPVARPDLHHPPGQPGHQRLTLFGQARAVHDDAQPFVDPREHRMRRHGPSSTASSAVTPK